MSTHPRRMAGGRNESFNDVASSSAIVSTGIYYVNSQRRRGLCFLHDILYFTAHCFACACSPERFRRFQFWSDKRERVFQENILR